MSRLMPTLLKPYFFRKVMRKPNPTNIITCTSWNTEKKKKRRKKNSVLGKNDGSVASQYTPFIKCYILYIKHCKGRALTGQPKTRLQCQPDCLPAMRLWASCSIFEPFLGIPCALIPQEFSITFHLRKTLQSTVQTSPALADFPSSPRETQYFLLSFTQHSTYTSTSAFATLYQHLFSVHNMVIVP